MKAEKQEREKPAWSEIKKFLSSSSSPCVRGPIMGHADPSCRRWNSHLGCYQWGVDGLVRLWAPANVGAPDERHIMWMPLAFCEEFIDLRIDSAAFFGSHPVPEIVEQGYKAFVEHFLEDSYKMKPLLAQAGVDGVLHTAEDTPVATDHAYRAGGDGLCAKPADHADPETGEATEQTSEVCALPEEQHAPDARPGI